SRESCRSICPRSLPPTSSSACRSSLCTSFSSARSGPGSWPAPSTYRSNTSHHHAPSHRSPVDTHDQGLPLIPDVLAYYFPHWHADERDSRWFRPGFTEWELVRNATPRFPGHRQPRIPTLGYRDETDPRVMDSEVQLARAHGIDGFIFDYYWYDDGPYLQRALDEGFLGRGQDATPMRFALMWANHDLLDLYPLPAPSSGAQPRLLRPGGVGLESFEQMTDHVVSAYFAHPDYYTVDGKPFFSIYELGTFVAAIGGVEAAAEALAGLDRKARQAGLPGVHVDAVVWGAGILPNHVTISRPREL